MITFQNLFFIFLLYDDQNCFIFIISLFLKNLFYLDSLQVTYFIIQYPSNIFIIPPKFLHFIFINEQLKLSISYFRFDTLYFQPFIMLLIYQNPLNLNFILIINPINIVFQLLFLY